MIKQEEAIYIKVSDRRFEILPNQNIIINGKRVRKRIFKYLKSPEDIDLSSIIGVKLIEVDEDTLYIGQPIRYVIKDNHLLHNEFTYYFTQKYPELIPAPTYYDNILKRYPKPDITTGFYVDEELWYYLIRQILRKKQVLLTGASGTGKTELVYHILSQLKEHNLPKEPDTFDMAVQNPEASFKGQIHISNGKSFFKYSRFAKVIQKPNRCVLLDEFNRGDIATQNILMPVLDKRRTLYIERAEGSEIKVHPTTFFWATANIGYSYSGTSQIDEAVSQRFQIINIDYPPEDAEIKVLQVRIGIDREQAKYLVDFANKIRNDEVFQKKPSLRMLLEAAELIRDGFDKINAIKYSIMNQVIDINDIDSLSKFNQLL